MMKNVLIYFLLFFSILLHAQVDTNLVEVKQYTIDSKFLETERNYWVSLPSNYDSTNTYPVMYVLDAEWRFSITNALEKELSSDGKIPAHIVVGITHPNRRLDMSFSTTKVNHKGQKDTVAFNAKNSGNGLPFLNFIENELIKEVNQKYATSGFNILIGHSLGGYFCSYILPQQKSFRSLQIYDPSIWYSEGEAVQQIQDNLSKQSNCIVFISSSGNYKNQFTNHHKKIKKLNRTLNRFRNIRNKYKNYKDESHNSMFLHSFIDGTSMLYDGYEMKAGGLETKNSASEIEVHFKQFSEKIQFEFTPPMHLYFHVGVANFHQRKYANCVEALEIYLEKNPKHRYVLELTGDAYFGLGKKAESLKYYTKAYELSPENIGLKKKIEKYK